MRLIVTVAITTVLLAGLLSLSFADERALYSQFFPPRQTPMDWNREAGRRICDAYRVTGNEWTNCVTFYEQNPPCPPPPDARWETCVRGAAGEAQRKVEEARRQAAERRRQAELEERRVRALEESAQAQRDAARAQEGQSWGINRPPACTKVLVAPGVVRTVCN